MSSSREAIEPASSKLKNYVLRLLRASRDEDSDQVAMFLDSLVARGLISPDALEKLTQQVNDIRGRPAPLGSQQIEAGGGRGVGGAVGPGDSGKVVAPDYRAKQTKPYGYWNEQGRDQVQKMLDEGKTIREINEALGSSAGKATTKFELKSKNSTGPRPKPDEDIQAIRDMRSQNMTWDQIAKKIGKSSGGSVYNLAKRYGLTGNPEWFDQEMEQ